MESAWEKHWQANARIGDTGTIYGRWSVKKKLEIIQSELARIPRCELSVLDVGCGSGETLAIFQSLGFANLHGLDCSQSALDRCAKNLNIPVKNLHLLDARNTRFPSRSFGLVFEEGLWEHYRHDYPDFVREACRIADKYLVALQPNHFSLIGSFAKIGWEIFSRNKGGVREYSHRLSNYKKIIWEQGFAQVDEQHTFGGGYVCMTFRRTPDRV